MIDQNYTHKHREDVIDTLKLRARERRVLYGLIIILLLTVFYENGGDLFSSLITGNFETATLGSRKKLTIKPEVMKKISRAFAPVLPQYPQYAGRLKHDAALLEDAIKLASTPELAEKAVDSSRTAVLRLFEFTSHPVIGKSKQLEALEKELVQAAKLLQIKLTARNDYPGINFKKTPSMVESTGQRNLFSCN